jgi:hypothetical protein
MRLRPVFGQSASSAPPSDAYFDIGVILAVANLAVLKFRAHFSTSSLRSPDGTDDKRTE